ncbi:SCO2400 family protein [Streptomyces sp.]|uniref:SCO2400 family protein n=1 Tax=Streptomyces sp. TaxID=1931 RepID=UPI002D5D9B65|nr:hypothetical protein [Streptomyces sp.]HZF89107.1 hypothetical protein [Streptomyces sp.]
MDYCSTCRRHLNGALVCPGCGAYAPDIDPSAARTARDSSPVTRATAMVEAAGIARTEPDDTYPEQPPAPRGRAARRRQLARWKKTQRRAVVATAVALVGGGLTVAGLHRGAPDRAQAATAPEHPDAPAAREQAPQYDRPPIERPDSARSPRTSPAPAEATDSPRQQAPAVAAHTEPAGARQLLAAPAPAAPASPPRASAPSADPTGPARTGTAADTGHTPLSPPPPPPAGDAEDTSGTGSSGATGGTGGTDASQPGSSPADTAPAQLCLLVVCLG